jgi:lipopolysaccharide transport system ATP-binding protein
MSDTAISAAGLAKSYRIGARQDSYRTLRDELASRSRRAWRWLRRGAESGAGNEDTLIWALRDASFEVHHGDVVGVLGRNGAGKSTLLKILSRITEPTEGYADINGRVGSLLEVGIGFHEELTGRENVFLNGAIIGMSRSEIQQRFDEIVAFAEIERYLDTPVKHYSSGMYLRLAFAVAAHLETEILLVDEVLAVGDHLFQKKCLGKINSVSNEGRTVLLVSHNINAIMALCKKALLLDRGKLVAFGSVSEIVSRYTMEEKTAERTWPSIDSSPGSDIVRLKAIRVLSEGQARSNVPIDRDLFVEVEFTNLKHDTLISTSIHLLDRTGSVILATANMPSACSNHDAWLGRPYPRGDFKTICRIPANFLNEGEYKIELMLLTNYINLQARVEDALCFSVFDTGEMRKEYVGRWVGVIRPKFEWFTEVEALEPRR